MNKMEENIENIDTIRRMKKEIAELKKEKEDMLHTSPAEPEVPESKHITDENVLDPIENPIEIKEIKEESKFTPPDPIIPILNEPPKKPKTESKEFEGGIYIEWIDHRYHINGVRGIPNGNKIIVRSLKAVDSLIRHLQNARDAFNQKEMINTKSPK